MHGVQREPVRYAIGENPVPAVAAGLRLAGIEHAVDIYQDQRGEPLHADMLTQLAGQTPPQAQASGKRDPDFAARPNELLRHRGHAARAPGRTERLRASQPPRGLVTERDRACQVPIGPSADYAR